MKQNIVLSVDNLHTSFYTPAGKVKAVDGVSFNIREGETLGIVGESGSGKSVTSMSIMRLVMSPGKIEEGSIKFNDVDILKLPQKEMSKIRGNQISMIFQDPMTALNPCFTVGEQIAEGIRFHKKLNKKESFNKAVEMLRKVRIPEPEKRAKQYPHEFSGGMRQRVMIAMALACNPTLLIADEPTTALDVTVQAQILELMKSLQKDYGMSIMMITHDLGVVAETCKNVMVMYAGNCVEYADVFTLFENSKHPYTWGLMASQPNLEDDKDELVPIEGTPPDLTNPKSMCNFAPRCKYAKDICFNKKPDFVEIEAEHFVACHFQNKENSLERSDV